jgi:hypothetical protein
MPRPSHVNCRGKEPGCRKRAHGGNKLDLCQVCFRARKAEMEAQGMNVYGHPQSRQAEIVTLEGIVVPSPFGDSDKTRKALDLLTNGIKATGALGDDDLLGSITDTRYGLEVEAIMADASTGGQGHISPEQRLMFAQDLLAQAGPKAAFRYMRGFGPNPFGKILCPRWELVPTKVREEIRELVNSGAATEEEVCATYHLTAEAFQGVMHEIREPEPEDEPVAVEVTAEPEIVLPPAPNKTAEHMQKMREARARKQRERDEELERLRASQNGHEASHRDTLDRSDQEPREPLFPFHQELGPAWKVTILRPTEVTVHATTLAGAMAEVQNAYGAEPESILGIVRV